MSSPSYDELEIVHKHEEQVVRLNHDWHTHQQLFGPPSNFAVFDDAVPSFWNRLQVERLDSIFLAIGRLMDPERTGKKENLSLQRFVNLSIFDENRAAMQVEYTEIESLWTNIKVWRDTHIAHHDLATRFDPTLLPPVTMEQISELINRISKLHKWTYRNAGISVDLVPKELGGVPLLIEILREGVEARKNRFKTSPASPPSTDARSPHTPD